MVEMGVFGLLVLPLPYTVKRKLFTYVSPLFRPQESFLAIAGNHFPAAPTLGATNAGCRGEGREVADAEAGLSLRIPSSRSSSTG